MNDQTLLELAAKAAGIGPVLCYEGMRNCLRIGTRDSYKIWSPLSGSDHAMSLAVKLGICIVFFEDQKKVGAEQSSHGVIAFESLDVAGTRRAIVRAAAAIAKATA
ncbi:hypothetical protein ACA087_00625 [Pseudomonas chlororaphis]|uniref:hypothetical protein n=1 Tax=Pseudomonas chlororaphis TaxID=587753 RepID=UPI003529DB07